MSPLSKLSCTSPETGQNCATSSTYLMILLLTAYPGETSTKSPALKCSRWKICISLTVITWFEKLYHDGSWKMHGWRFSGCFLNSACFGLFQPMQNTQFPAPPSAFPWRKLTHCCSASLGASSVTSPPLRKQQLQDCVSAKHTLKMSKQHMNSQDIKPEELMWGIYGGHVKDVAVHRKK